MLCRSDLEKASTHSLSSFKYWILRLTSFSPFGRIEQWYFWFVSMLVHVYSGCHGNPTSLLAWVPPPFASRRPIGCSELSGWSYSFNIIRYQNMKCWWLFLNKIDEKENRRFPDRQDHRWRHLWQSSHSHSHSNRVKSRHQDCRESEDHRKIRFEKSLKIINHPQETGSSQCHSTPWTTWNRTKNLHCNWVYGRPLTIPCHR